MFSKRAILALFLLPVLCFGCVEGFLHFKRNGAELPVEVCDPGIMGDFLAVSPSLAVRVPINLPPEWRTAPYIPPDPALNPSEYLPASYGEVLRDKLYLRSFSSLAKALSPQGMQFLKQPGWRDAIVRRDVCSADSYELLCSFVVFATLDYNGNGRRDWLVLGTQISHRDPSYTSMYWLLIEDPSPEDEHLEARLLALEEKQGVVPDPAQPKPPVLTGQAAEEKILAQCRRIASLPDPEY